MSNPKALSAEITEQVSGGHEQTYEKIGDVVVTDGGAVLETQAQLDHAVGTYI